MRKAKKCEPRPHYFHLFKVVYLYLFSYLTIVHCTCFGGVGGNQGTQKKNPTQA